MRDKLVTPTELAARIRAVMILCTNEMSSSNEAVAHLAGSVVYIMEGKADEYLLEQEWHKK